MRIFFILASLTLTLTIFSTQAFAYGHGIADESRDSNSYGHGISYETNPGSYGHGIANE